jgi:hypothetical protein
MYKSVISNDKMQPQNILYYLLLFRLGELPTVYESEIPCLQAPQELLRRPILYQGKYLGLARISRARLPRRGYERNHGINFCRCSSTSCSKPLPNAVNISASPKQDSQKPALYTSEQHSNAYRRRSPDVYLQRSGRRCHWKGVSNYWQYAFPRSSSLCLRFWLCKGLLG